MDAAIAALLGASIGTIGSFGVTWIQQKNQARRERLKVAADMGLADYKLQIELMKGRSAKIAPVSSFVMYHLHFLEALEEGDITPEIIERLTKKQRELMNSYYDYRNPSES